MAEKISSLFLINHSYSFSYSDTCLFSHPKRNFQDMHDRISILLWGIKSITSAIATSHTTSPESFPPGINLEIQTEPGRKTVTKKED